MNHRIAVAVLSLASTLMPIAAHADPRDGSTRTHQVFVQPVAQPAPVRAMFAPPLAHRVFVQPVYAQPAYAPTVYVQPTGYAQPVAVRPMRDRDDRHDARFGRDERGDREWHNGHHAQYGLSPRGRWQGQFGGR